MIKRERLTRFIRLVSDCYRELRTIDALIEVIKSKERYSPLLRAAALRNLIRMAPIEVKQGQPYLRARRLVRAHYGV